MEQRCRFSNFSIFHTPSNYSWPKLFEMLNLHEASWKLGHRVENSKAAGNERRRSKTEMSCCKFCQNSSIRPDADCKIPPTFYLKFYHTRKFLISDRNYSILGNFGRINTKLYFLCAHHMIWN